MIEDEPQLADSVGQLFMVTSRLIRNASTVDEDDQIHC